MNTKASSVLNHSRFLEALEPRLLLDGNPNLWPIALPNENIADIPVMQPSVITSGGQRLLLGYFNNNGNTPADDVTVTYDPRTDQLVSNKPGWWVINYPLDQILGLPNINNHPAGMTDAQIKDLVAADLFGPGNTAADVRNWYIMTPVDANHPLAAEPGEPTGPAPIIGTDLSNCYVIVVDNDLSHTDPVTDPWVAARIAAAQNVTVDSAMYRTVQSAMDRVYDNAYSNYNTSTNTLTKKTVILVAPGTYRERVCDWSASGTADYPLIFEGVPDNNGKMPTISGATKFADSSWTLQSVLGDVDVSGENLYRATIPSTGSDWDSTPYQHTGPVAANDQAFIQRSNPAFLDEGEMAFNTGSTEYLNMYGMTESGTLTGAPSTGQTAAPVTDDGPTSGLMARWDLNETTGTSAGDWTGNGHTGTLNNFPASPWTTGKLKNALTFDGTDDYVSAPSSSGFNFGAGALTISAWIKLADGASLSGNAYFPIIQRGVGQGGAYWQLGLDAANNGLRFETYDGSMGMVSVPDSDMSATLGNHSWHLVTVTRSASGMTYTLYVDGTSVDVGTMMALNPDSANPVVIGYRNNGTATYFPGLIDDARIYNQALSPTDVGKLAKPDIVNGSIDFTAVSASPADKVFWVDSWVWVPAPSGCGYLNDGKALFAGNNFTYGPFRATPHESSLNDQANPYRLWVNGQATGQIWNSEGDFEQGLPHPDVRAYQPLYGPDGVPVEDDWINLSLNVGWNHLVFQFDTSVANNYQGNKYADAPMAFKFTVSGCTFVSKVYSQATQPGDLNVGPTGGYYSNYISAFNVLGTFAATTPDTGVYVRPTTAQSANRNPNNVMTELANRTLAFGMRTWENGAGSYVKVRGFDCRFAGIYLGGVGNLMEGNYMRDSGWTFNNNRDVTYQRLGYNYYTADGNYIDITNGSTSNLTAGDTVSFPCLSGETGPAMPAPLLGAHSYFIGANQPGTNKWKLFDSKADAQAGTDWIVLTQAANGTSTLLIARHNIQDEPTVLMNNWTINGTWGDNCTVCTFFDDVNQNAVDANGVLDLPGHARTFFEYNRIVNFNPRGLWFGWDWAAMGKGFGAVQNTYVYNVFDGGEGLGVWLDTDNFNNRFDGNLFLNMHSAALNVEASPGPNLLANNIIVSNPDNAGADIATWSCNRDWAVHNTIVGDNGSSPAMALNTSENEQRWSPWNDPSIPSGVWPHDPVWHDHLDARQAYVNNLFLNCATATSADTNASTPDTVVGNYTDNAADITVNPFFQAGQNATSNYLPTSAMGLANPDNNDYRLTASSLLNNLGAPDVDVWTTVDGVETTMVVNSLVTHDFYGLLRFSGDGTSVGATRSYHNYTSTTLEVEYADGTMQRLQNYQYMPARWKFNDGSGTTATNSGSGGSSLNGTLVNNPTWGSGEINGGLTLSGANQYVDVPANAAMTFGANDPFSISAWVKLANGAPLGTASDHYAIMANRNMNVRLQGGGYNGLVFGLYDDPHGRYPQLTAPPGTQNVFLDYGWHHVVATRDGSGVATMYLDGSYLCSSSGFNDVTELYTNPHIGADWYWGYNSFNGTLDDVRYYTRSLSSTEVAGLDDVQAVSISATDNQASELGNTGTFTVTRTGHSTDLPLMVRYNTTGSTATNGVDYATLSGIVTIPAGQSSATITVAPVDTAFGNNETVIVNLLASDDASTQYNLTGTTSDTVTLVSSLNGPARWKLNETSGTTAYNSGSGANLDGTRGSLVTWSDGYLNGGANFTGQGWTDPITVPQTTSNDIEIGTGPFTLSQWLRLDQSVVLNDIDYASYPVISNGALYQNAPTFNLDVYGGGYRGLFFLVGNIQAGGSEVSDLCANEVNVNSLLSDHQWHLVTATRDATGLGLLYVDGIEVGRRTGMTQAVTSLSTPTNIWIGRGDWNGTFKGNLDDVRIYTRALSPAEIVAMHNAVVVSIAATDNQASELGNTGAFTVTRTGSTANALTVSYTVSGYNTTNGTTYLQLPGTVTIPAGQSSAAITVTPIDAAIPGGSGTVGTVVLTLADDPNSQYELSHPLGSATVNFDNSNYPLANWKFDAGSGNTAVNSGSGASLDGTLVNNPTWGAGETDGGLTFNGTNQYVDVPYNTTMAGELSFGTGGFTISSWVKLDQNDNFSNVYYPIISIGDPGSAKNMTLYLSNQGGYEWTPGLYFHIQGGGSWVWLPPNPDVSNVFRDHQWHMVTVTRDENGIGRLYLDGSTIMINLGGGQGRVAGLSMSYPVLNFTNGNRDLLIGANGWGNYFKGSLDNVQVYNRGLSGSEVQKLAVAPVLKAAAVSTSQINLSWTDECINETGYQIWRAPDNAGAPGTFAQIDTVGANVTTYDNTTGLTDGTKYWYEVRAYNTTYGNSGFSNQYSAITALIAPAAAPTFGSVTDSQVVVSWAYGGASETDFLIDRATDSSFTQNLTTIDTHSTSLSYTDSGVTAPTLYYYRVRAVNALSTSVNSPTGAVTVLAAPTIQAASAITSNTLTVNWTYTGSSETGFKVDRATDSGFTQNLNTFTVANPAARSYDDSGLAEGTTYYYRVYAYSTLAGNSATSDNTALTLLATPTIGTCTSITATQIQVNWTDNSAHENGYKVERSYDAATWTTVHTGGSGSGSMNWTDTAVLPSTTYYYRVTATTSGTPVGDSVPSTASPAATTPSNELGMVLSDYWYGANGTAWNGQWSYINQTTNATVALTVQSNKGQASFTRSAGTMSGQYLAYVNTNNLVDSDQKVTFTASTSGTYISLIARGSATDATAQYYFARAYVNSSSTTLAIYKRTYSGGVGTDTSLASTSIAIRAGTSYNLRFQCITSGSTTNLKANIWSATTNEPTTTWTVSTTNNSFQGVSGRNGLRYNLKSATSGTQTFTTDNYQAVDASSGNSTLLDTFQGGTASNWTAGTGTWSVVSNSYSNRYYLSVNPGGSNNLLGAYSTINSPASVGNFTFTCEAKATVATGNYAVVFGYQSAGNYYYMNFDGTSGNTKLYKVVGGTASVIATVSGTIIADTSAHQIKITRVGRGISVWYDGQNLLNNVLDDTFIGGKIGLGAKTGLAYFDNVTVG